MDKLAQKRSLRSKIWETVNLSGRALEGLHSEFAAVMDEMRNIDDNIRNIAEDVKPLIRTAKSALRTRDYLNAALNISEFHRRVRHIAFILGKFVTDVDVKHYKFLLEDFDTSNKEQLLGYNPNAELKSACNEFDSLIKEAGVYDWAKEKTQQGYDVITDTTKNIVTDKGKARRLLQKRFDTAFMKDVRVLTEKLVERSERMLRDLLNVFDQLESGISRRNPRVYVIKSKEFIKKFDDYHKTYENYHNKIISPLKEHEDKIKKEIEEVEVEEAKKSPFVTPYVDNEDEKTPLTPVVTTQVKPQPQPQPQPSVKTVAPIQKEPEYTEPTFDEWKAQNFPNTDESDELFDDEKSKQPVLKNPKAAHNQFISKLEAYAGKNDVVGLVQELINYSEILDNSNPIESKELLITAQNILHDYKSAGILDFLKKDKPEDLKKNEPQEPAKKQEVQQSNKIPQKPKELIEEEENLYKIKKIDLPEGRIDKAYVSIPILSNITADKIRITLNTAQSLMKTFIHRLANIKNIDNFKPYIKSVESNLIPTLKQATYNGWIVSAANVMDTHNPNDKYLDIYTRLNISNIDSNLSGIAKINIACRLSASNNTLTIRGVNKYFTLENVKENIPSSNDSDESDEYDTDNMDQYDYPDDR